MVLGRVWNFFLLEDLSKFVNNSVMLFDNFNEFDTIDYY